MQIKVWNNNHANHRSKYEDVLEVDDEEWTNFSEEEKENFVREWAFSNFDFGWEE